jgi:hypothetical protein
MIQSKNFVAALAFIGLLTTGGVANADGQFYVELGASHADPGDVLAEFTIGNESATWSLDDLHGAKFQIGGDFGYFRTDLKARAFQGEVDSVTGASDITSGGKGVILGVVTLNGYLDIYDIKLGDTDAFITPFVGIGGGYAHGVMQADGVVAGIRRTDHRQAGGLAIVGTVGALFSLNQYIGLSADYERIDTDAGGVDANTYNLGLRVTF